MSLFGLEPSRPPATGAWRATPYKTTVAADSAGVALITLPSIPEGVVWVVERINVAADSSAEPVPTVAMFDSDDPSSATFLDGSSTGTSDVDDRAVLTLFPGDRLTFAWDGCNPGDPCSVRVQYRVEQLAV